MAAAGRPIALVRRSRAVTGVNPVTSVGFSCADPLAGTRHLYALAPDCCAIAHLRSVARG